MDTAGTGLPFLTQRLCDDAAVFPPGLMPLPDALPAHALHLSAAHAELVGPLVLAAPALTGIAALLRPEDRIDLAVTLPSGPAQAAGAFAVARELPVVVRALEVAVPHDLAPARLLAELDAAVPAADEVEVFVEIPRDERRPELIRSLSGTRYRAKFRTGGVTADLHPDERELAAAIAAAVAAAVPFKATAGLHHAIRNTEAASGFEQHGFLNLLLATDAALQGAGTGELSGILADRDAQTIAGRVADLDAGRVSAARASFRSFGTCSITDPLTDLVALGLVPAGAIGPQAEKE